MEQPGQWITMGKIVREWGLRGHVLFLPYNPHSQLYPQIRIIYVQSEGSFLPLTLEEAKPHGRFWRFRFASCQLPETARLLRGQTLALPRTVMPALPQGEVYVADLIGLRVFSARGEEVGRVRASMQVGEHDVLVIDTPDRREVMIPYLSVFVASTSFEKQEIVLKEEAQDLIEGV